MSDRPLENVTTLTFDVFGTVLDLTGSLEGPTGRFLRERSAPTSPVAGSTPSGAPGSASNSSRTPS